MIDPLENSPAQSTPPEILRGAVCRQCFELLDADDNFCRSCGEMTEHGATLVAIGKLSPRTSARPP